MLKKLLKLLQPKPLEPKCRRCKYRNSARSGEVWYCRKQTFRKKGDKRHVYWTTICGNKPVKTSPKWCPRRKEMKL